MHCRLYFYATCSQQHPHYRDELKETWQYRAYGIWIMHTCVIR